MSTRSRDGRRVYMQLHTAPVVVPYVRQQKVRRSYDITERSWECTELGDRAIKQVIMVCTYKDRCYSLRVGVHMEHEGS